MTFNNSAIIIVIVVAFAFYLIYSQNNQPKYIFNHRNKYLILNLILNHHLAHLAQKIKIIKTMINIAIKKILETMIITQTNPILV